MSSNINFLINKIKKNRFKNPKKSYTSFLIKKGSDFCIKKLLIVAQNDKQISKKKHKLSLRQR